jgi:hypothetical protein
VPVVPGSPVMRLVVPPVVPVTPELAVPPPIMPVDPPVVPVVPPVGLVIPPAELIAPPVVPVVPVKLVVPPVVLVVPPPPLLHPVAAVAMISRESNVSFTRIEHTRFGMDPPVARNPAAIDAPQSAYLNTARPPRRLWHHHSSRDNPACLRCL